MPKLKFSHALCFTLILFLAITVLLPGLTAYAEQAPTTVTPTAGTPTPAPVSTTAVLTPTAVVSNTATLPPTPVTTPPISDTPNITTPTPTAEVTKDPEEVQKEELKKKTLETANTYFLTRGQPLPEAIDEWLEACHSPQLQEAPAGKTIGQVYLELGWKYGINPAYALAFFTKESSCGTAGYNLAAHNFGNIRWTPGYPTLDGVWRSYPSWNAGMEDWFKLIKEGYIQSGASTLAQVLPIYAPEVENDTTLYINEVMEWVNIIMSYSPDRNLNLKYTTTDKVTGFQIGWDFLDYWRSHGGEAALGKPLGNQEYEKGLVVQYFEQGVLEFHPENKSGEKVLLRAITNDSSNAQASSPPEKISESGSGYLSQTLEWITAMARELLKVKAGFPLTPQN